MGETTNLSLKWLILLFVLIWLTRVTSVHYHANYYKKHAVKSIQSEDGDIIDCIDIYKQPAFDHHALRNHKIQMSPSHEQAMDLHAASNKSSNNEKPRMNLTSQLWRKNGSCPRGTIPIRRITRKQLRNSKGNEKYGTKGPSFPHQIKKPNDDDESNSLNGNRSYAILLTEGYNYNGAKAEIQVWNPYVEHDDEYSASRIALKNGPYYNYESVEAGWVVNPSVYGDNQTRIYVYWTADSSKTTGCFDLICPGFVQTSNEIAIGGVIQSIPVPGGLPWIMTLYIVKDIITHNWWLQYQENTYIGYWPAELFKRISITAATVQWGGEVYSTRIGHPGHTKTEMGSGQIRTTDSRSGWTKKMRIRDNSMLLKYPEWVYSFSDDYDCYSAHLVWEYLIDPEFYFGGPGKGWMSWRCT